MQIMINPSLMCMDFLNMRSELEVLNKRADLLHFDMMDGHYVPNITLSPDMAKIIAPFCNIPLDFHLMVTDPEIFLEPLANAVAPMLEKGIISFFSPHAEVLNGRAFRMFDRIRRSGFKTGVAINPETPFWMIESYLNHLDKITFMSVDPGFAGQTFIPEVLEKIRLASRLKAENQDKYHYIIEVDGACGPKTYRQLICAGAESLVMGTGGLFGKAETLEKSFDRMFCDMEQAVNQVE